jgi:hypothetical protein
VKKFKEDQDGAAIAIFFVILIPLLFMALVGIVTFTNAVTNSDVTVQESVAISSKAAAVAFNTTAQSAGIIRINTDQAHENFKKSLCESLGLKEDLTPNTEAFTDKPEYWLLVYNGYDDYTGCACAKLYHYNGTTTTQDLSSTKFPVTFSISESGIVAGDGANAKYKVELKTPGVISAVKIDASNIVNKSSSTIVRWASARIVGHNGNFKVI